MANKQTVYDWCERLTKGKVTHAEAGTPGGALVLDIELEDGTVLRLTTSAIRLLALDIFEPKHTSSEVAK